MRKVDWTALMKRERAASALTYGLVVGLVAVLSIGAVRSVGDSVTELFGGVATDLAGGESCAANSASDGAGGTYSHGALTHRASVTVVAEAAQSGDHPDLSNESAYRLDVTIICNDGTASADTAVAVATACEAGYTLEGSACFETDCATFTAADEDTNKGTLCSDDTFYIGHHDYGDGAGQVPLFAAACDIGRTFDPSANGGRGGCTGQWDLMAWNDGTLTYEDVDSDGDGEILDLDDNLGSPGEAADDYRGREKTAILAAITTQTHEAAQGCADFDDPNSAYVGAADGWYLPAMGELDIVWAATHPSASVTDDNPSWLNTAQEQSSGTDFAQTFDDGIFSRNYPCDSNDNSVVDESGSPCMLWSASEAALESAWDRGLSGGWRLSGDRLKDHRMAIRCVRR